MKSDDAIAEPAPTDRRVAALLTLAEGGLMAAAVLFGSLVTGLLLGVGVIPDPQTHPWALFTVSPLMLAIGAGAYELVTRFAMPKAGIASEPAGERNLRAPLPPAEGFETVPRALGIAVSHTVLALGGSMLLAVALEALGMKVEEQPVILEIVAGGFGWRPDLIGLAVGAVILAPLTEEWLFRGLLFRRLWLSGVPVAAYLIPSLLFAIIHFNLAGLLTYLWLGLVFAHAYRLTGRLWVAMLVHFGNNAFTFFVLVSGAAALAEGK